MKNCKQLMQSRQGFSLVELSLALFAVSLALMAVFALFPSGMKASRFAQEDTICALFADDVFAAMRADSFELTDTEWGAYNTRTFDIAKSYYQNSGAIAPLQPNNPTFQEISYEMTLSGPNGPVQVENHTLRYKLTLQNGANPNTKLVTLEVFPFQIRGFLHTYYTEIYRWRME